MKIYLNPSKTNELIKNGIVYDEENEVYIHCPEKNQFLILKQVDLDDDFKMELNCERDDDNG